MKAFPSRESIYGSDVIGVKENSGMDLRDYFAIRAMQSIIIYEEGNFNFMAIAEESYKVADAMIKVREK